MVLKVPMIRALVRSKCVPGPELMKSFPEHHHLPLEKRNPKRQVIVLDSGLFNRAVFVPKGSRV